MTDDVLTFEELRRAQTRERDTDTLQELDDGFFDRARNYLEMKRDPDSHLENREYRNARNILEDLLDMRQKKIVRLAFLAVKSDVQVEHLMAREEELFEAVREHIDDYRSDLHDDLFTIDPGADGGEEVGEQPEELDEAAGQQSGEEPADTPEQGAPVEEVSAGDASDDASQGGTQIFGGDDDDAGTGAEPDAGADRDEGEAADDAGDTEEPDGTADDDTETVVMTQDVSEFMGVDMTAYGPYEEGDEATLPAKNADVLVDQGKAERE